MARGALEIRRGRKTIVLEVQKARSSMRPRTLAHSQVNKWKDLEPGHARARPPALQHAQVGEKNENGQASSPKSLTLSRSSLLPLAFSLSLFFPQISHIWYFYHLLPPFVPTHFLSAMLLAFLPIDFPIKTSKGSYGKSWEETQALPHILFRSLELKGKL